MQDRTGAGLINPQEFVKYSGQLLRILDYLGRKIDFVN
jgi:hypothetical protein